MVSRTPRQHARRGREVRADEEGFTIIEILVAMLLLTLVLTGTMAIQVVTMRAQQDSQTTSTASMIAQARLERFYAQPYTKISTSPESPDCFDYSGIELSSCSAATKFFTRTSTMSSTGSGYKLAVTVSWPTVNGQLTVEMQGARTP